MSRITDVLAEAGLDAEAAAKAESAIMRDYRSKEETEKKAERIRALESEVAAYREQVERLSSTDETDALKAKVAEMERADRERRERDAEDEARAKFKADFDAAVGERRFANEYTAESVFEKAYSKHRQFPEVDAKDIVDQLTGGDGVFAEPTRDPARQPMPQAGSKNADDAFAGFVSNLMKG